MGETILTTPEGHEYVLVPKARYEALAEAEEDLADVLAHREFRAKLEAGEEELLPAAMVDRILAGESPVRVWREHRGLTAVALANAANVSPAYLSEIERGVKPGSVTALKARAGALEVSMDDLVG